MALDGDGGKRDRQELSCRSKHTRGVDRLSIGVSAARTSTTDSVGLVSVRLRSCYSMR